MKEEEGGSGPEEGAIGNWGDWKQRFQSQASWLGERLHLVLPM